MTTTEHITLKGQSAIKVTCECRSHNGHGKSAIIVGKVAVALDARKGKKRDDLIHGHILMANHPAEMMRKVAEKGGIFSA